MGESAKLLNPEKVVLMPNLSADCAMAHMADAGTIRKMRDTYEDLAVVCYINSTAELKRHSDVCVTSANAVKIVRELPNKNIFFIPDRNLARFVAAKVPEKHFVFNDGYCPVHEEMKREEIDRLKLRHPEAPVLVHPECLAAICDNEDKCRRSHRGDRRGGPFCRPEPSPGAGGCHDHKGGPGGQ